MATAAVGPAEATGRAPDDDSPACIRRPWPFACCPGCGDDRFSVEPALATAVFTCAGCGASWRYQLGYLIRLAPGGADQTALPTL